MEIAKISLCQLLILVLMFEIVSAIISGFGAEAKQDAWITAIPGMLKWEPCTVLRVVRFYIQIPILFIIPLILLYVGWIQEKKLKSAL